jgi:hypothetical protein
MSSFLEIINHSHYFTYQYVFIWLHYDLWVTFFLRSKQGSLKSSGRWYESWIYSRRSRAWSSLTFQASLLSSHLHISEKQHLIRDEYIWTVKKLGFYLNYNIRTAHRMYASEVIWGIGEVLPLLLAEISYFMNKFQVL